MLTAFFARRCTSYLAAGLLLCGNSFLSDQSLLSAQSVPAEATVWSDAKVENGQLAKLNRQLFLTPQDLDAGRASLPRMAASLTAVHWLGHEAAGTPSLKIEQQHWELAWRERPTDAKVIVLSFDSPPQLLSETKPLRATGDDAVYLPASRAATLGEKIRYEPQTFKNTVGYWVGKHDQAVWQFQAARPGIYNVGILQGCGAGQGGSTAKLTVAPGKVDMAQLAASGSTAAATTVEDSAAPQSLQFEVLETGHFQNFQWRHLGQIEITARGPHILRIEPVAIKKNALMDVRAVHLVPLPN